MIEKIKENNVWENLKNTNLPVIIYGMGNGAEKIIKILNDFEIEWNDIFASDEFVRGHSFLGKKVLKYSEICEKYEDFIVVMAFASERDDVLERVDCIRKKHTVVAPDIAVAGNGLFTKEYIKKNEELFDKSYELLADEKSKSDFVDILNFKVSGKVEYLYNCFTDKNDIYKDILDLNNNETIIDLGAYNGDTIREICAYTDGKYDCIHAFEPDKKNFKKLVKNTENMQGVHLYNLGAWDKKDTLIFSQDSSRNSHISANGISVEVTDIDSVINSRVSLLKMDIEGSELKALNGAKHIIKTYMPKLYVCAYHRNEDMFSLPLKIDSIGNSNYKIYFRHTKYIPAWESNFYCIPK